MKIKCSPRKEARHAAKLSTELEVVKEAAEPFPKVGMSRTKAELKELARTMGLSTKGTKQDIVDRTNT